MTSSPTAQEKLLDYCDISGSWLYLDNEQKNQVYQKLLGKTFLFNYISDPEESKWWFPNKEEQNLINDKYEETYVG